MVVWQRKTTVQHNLHVHVNMWYKEFPKVCGWIWFLSNELCVFYPRALARGLETHSELNKNHIQPQTMGDPTCICISVIVLGFHGTILTVVLQMFIKFYDR